MATPTLTKNPDGTQTNQSGVTYSASGGAVIPTVPTAAAAAPIDASTLSSTPSPFTLPPAPAPSTYDISTLPSITSLLAPTVTPAQQKQTDLETKLEADTQSLAGKTAAQTTAEDAAAKALGAPTGLSDFNTQLTDINTQLGTLQKEAAAAQIKSEDRLAPTFAISGEQAQIEHQRSIKALGLSAIAQTLQGNIASAQATAQRAVDLQFAPVQSEIDYLTQAISDNKDNLSREDQQRADELQVQLQARQTQLDQQKEDKTTILSWAAEAAKNGADAVTINKAIALTDPAQALQVLGQFLSDPVAKQQALANLQLTRANINKTNTEASIEANPANKPATQAQQTQANYASRLVQANQIINDVTTSITSANPLTYGLSGFLPSALQSSTRQQYEQAQKNFVNAVLRQESGAAISSDEFNNAEKQYFPQPGDSAQTIANKSANRDLVIRNYINASGNAYEAPPSTSAQTYVVNGTTYVQGSDGLYYPQ